MHFSDLMHLLHHTLPCGWSHLMHNTWKALEAIAGKSQDAKQIVWAPQYFFHHFCTHTHVYTPFPASTLDLTAPSRGQLGTDSTFPLSLSCQDEQSGLQPFINSDHFLGLVWLKQHSCSFFFKPKIQENLDRCNHVNEWSQQDFTHSRGFSPNTQTRQAVLRKFKSEGYVKAQISSFTWHPGGYVMPELWRCKKENTVLERC